MGENGVGFPSKNGRQLNKIPKFSKVSGARIFLINFHFFEILYVVLNVF